VGTREKGADVSVLGKNGENAFGLQTIYFSSMQAEQRNKRVGQRNGRIQTGGAKKEKKTTGNTLGSATPVVKYETVEPKPTENKNAEIPGLIYVDDFLTEGEETELVKTIDDMDWNGKLEVRRTQHYGYDWDPGTNYIDPTTQKPLPDWISNIVQRLADEKYVPYVSIQSYQLCLTKNGVDFGSNDCKRVLARTRHKSAR